MGPTKNGALSELDKRLLEGNSDTQNPQNSPAEMTPSGGALKNILDQNVNVRCARYGHALCM